MTENEKLEYKATFGEWKEIIITLAAFANKHGGRVIVGVADDGSPAGLAIGKGTLEDFANKIRNHTDPVLYPSMNVKTFGPGEIVEIDVPESDNKPVFAFGRAYVRVGRSNQQMTNSAVRELIKRYTLPEFDSLCLPGGLSKYELDESAVLSLAKHQGIKTAGKSTASLLSSIGVLNKRKLTNAGYLCFASKNTAMRNAVVKAARFKGATMASFIDMKEFDDRLPAIVDPILEFVQRHTSMEVIITGKARRDEQWDYPLPALREAVINALVHRDYNDPGNVQMRVFDDRLEVWSPGLLPKELDVRTIGKEHRSIPRNRKLTEIFHALGLIEGWGSGFARMIQWSRDNGNGDPVFKESAGAFVIEFPRRPRGGVNGGVSGGVNGGVSGGVKDAFSNLLEVIGEFPGQRTNRIAERLGQPLDTTEKHLRRLKKTGKVEFRGSPKTGGYYLTNNPQISQ